MKRKISIGFSLLILLLSVFVSPLMSIAVGKEQNGVITSISATDHDGNPISNVGQWENFKVNVSFELPNNEVSAGDTTTLKLPNQLKFVNDTAFVLKDRDTGSIVANATVNASSKEIVLTYTNYVETHSDIKGTFYFYSSVDTTIVTEEKLIETSIDVGTKTFPIEINFSGIEKMDSSLHKSGWFLTGSADKIQYYVAINRNSTSFKDAVIKDKITTEEGISYVKESFRIIKGTWGKTDDSTDWEFKGETNDVTSDYDVIFSDDNKAFSINLGDISESDHFAIYYQTKLSYFPENNELIKNTVTLTSNSGTEELTSTANTRYQRGGGEVYGSQYSIIIHKEDEANNPLAGAKFDVIRVSSEAKVGTIITDSEGNGTLSGLQLDNYIIKETEAPVGYVLSSEKITVSKDDFVDKKAKKTIVNKRQSTPTPTPVPTTPTTKIDLNVNKVLVGKQLAAGAFSFELKDSTGKVLDTKTNTADGSIKFDALTYNHAGTYTYTISEVVGFEAGMTYDQHIVKVTVTVVEKDGQLVATASYEGARTFTNNFISAGLISLTANKSLTGKTLKAGAHQFELKDSEGKIIDTKTNGADGSINFDALTYNQAGTYAYTISEVIGSEKGMTYDSHLLKVTVTVVEKDGKFVATATYDGERTFKNSYKSEDPSLPKTNVTTPTTNKSLPKTNENMSVKYIMIGLLLLLTTIGIFYYRKKKVN